MACELQRGDTYVISLSISTRVLSFTNYISFTN